MHKFDIKDISSGIVVLRMLVGQLLNRKCYWFYAATVSVCGPRVLQDGTQLVVIYICMGKRVRKCTVTVSGGGMEGWRGCAWWGVDGSSVVVVTQLHRCGGRAARTWTHSSVQCGVDSATSCRLARLHEFYSWIRRYHKWPGIQFVRVCQCDPQASPPFKRCDIGNTQRIFSEMFTLFIKCFHPQKAVADCFARLFSVTRIFVRGTSVTSAAAFSHDKW